MFEKIPVDGLVKDWHWHYSTSCLLEFTAIFGIILSSSNSSFLLSHSYYHHYNKGKIGRFIKIRQDSIYLPPYFPHSCPKVTKKSFVNLRIWNYFINTLNWILKSTFNSQPHQQQIKPYLSPPLSPVGSGTWCHPLLCLWEWELTVVRWEQAGH